MQKGPTAYAATLLSCFSVVLFIFLPVFGEVRVVS